MLISRLFRTVLESVNSRVDFFGRNPLKEFKTQISEMALSDLQINQSEINVDTRNWPILQKVTDDSRKVTADLAELSYKPYISNIHALNSDTHTLRIQYEYTQKMCGCRY